MNAQRTFKPLLTIARLRSYGDALGDVIDHAREELEDLENRQRLVENLEQHLGTETRLVLRPVFEPPIGDLTADHIVGVQIFSQKKPGEPEVYLSLQGMLTLGEVIRLILKAANVNITEGSLRRILAEDSKFVLEPEEDE
jgi:hypothetical protein